MFKFLMTSFVAFSMCCCAQQSINQTDEISPILPPDSLPFKVSIVQADFQLPSDSSNFFGLQSFAYGIYNGKWLLFSGRTSGLHGFDPGDHNFPVKAQNTTVYVVDPVKKNVVYKSLLDSSSGLSQGQVDSLSVTAPQYHQVGKTLYFVGGYGVDTATGLFSTKSTLTAIDIPGLMSWVENESLGKKASQYIRQTSHPLLQVTGGFLSQANTHQPFLLFFGQNFTGFYTEGSNGIYTYQVRPFQIIDNGKKLYVQPGKQCEINPSYRRRDLNVLPIIQQDSTSYKQAFVTLGGVFTENGGMWTVPIFTDEKGNSFMAEPSDPNTFKQGVNIYDCVRASLFSKKTKDAYALLFGGITYAYEENGVFVVDGEFPFTNQVAAIKIDSKSVCQQFLMENQYPVLLSDFSNPGNVLLFGAEARFIPASELPYFSNGVFCIDDLSSKPTLLGYIVGGIQSTVPNTSTSFDSAASPYIFQVFLEKR